MVFDKTGTLTKGVFNVNCIHHNTMDEEKLLEYAAHCESASSHPISLSLKNAYGKEIDTDRVSDIKEISGHGITARVDNIKIAAGNEKLMESLGLDYKSCHKNGTIVHMAVDDEYAGHIVISDEVKADSKEAISKLKKEPKFCPQFHISLQSGCNKTLKNMNRHYTAEEYKALCDRLRTEFEGCTLTTDVMTGFPGESEEDFICSYAFVKEIGFEKLHVFPYSVREGTAAAKMKGQIDKKTKTERCKKMIALGEEIRQSFFEKQTGKSYDVLFEKKHEDGMFYGYTKNYIPVKVFSEDDLTGKIKPVMITGCDKECTGKICNKN